MPPTRDKPMDKTAWKKMKESRKAVKEMKMLRQVAKLEKAAKAAEAAQNNQEENVRSFKRSTLSIAIPSSILENAQSPELRTYLAGQIARAACVFKVDEVVVFDDIGTCAPNDVTFQIEPAADSGVDHKTPIRRSCVQMARILQYLEEGVVSNQPTKQGRGSLVNVGLTRDVLIDRQLEAGLRVTVKLLPPKEGSKKMQGCVVTPQTPEAVTGRYWGYSVRLASSLSAVFSQAPYSGGYDLTLGTSDKGENIDELVLSGGLPTHQHALVVFGGLAGLEGALEADPVIQVDDPSLLFDYYFNTCPDQGSRTIRTEEALLISLAALRPLLVQVNSSNGS
ncbi:Putative methyltransferase [Gryllus bimaculatus]|nr:Putative methyltransferase [Gryllus bimaculatus]